MQTEKVFSWLETIFKRFGLTVEPFDYHQRQANHTLFTMHAEDGKISILDVYINDIILKK